MKNEQKNLAEELFFQTELSKSQIAKTIGVSRRTVHHWILENNWERLKRSASNMPSMVAEKCYYMMNNLSEYILSEDRMGCPITREEADTIHKLAITVNKLKARNVLNENMEMFAWFIDDVAAGDPALAKQIQPYVNNYIAARAAIQPHHFKPAKMSDNGHMPIPQYLPDNEAELDARDLKFWSQQNNANSDKEERTEQTLTHAHCEPADRTGETDNLYVTSPSPRGEGRGEASSRQALNSWLPEQKQTQHLNRKQRRALAQREAKAKTRIAA